MSALVASVVPWISERTSAARLPASLSTVTTPCSTAWEGSLGVVRSLPTWTAPVASSTHTRSVKVPPMSTPMRVRRKEGGVMAPECHGAPAGSRQRQPRFYDREERETGRARRRGRGCAPAASPTRLNRRPAGGAQASGVPLRWSAPPPPPPPAPIARAALVLLAAQIRGDEGARARASCEAREAEGRAIHGRRRARDESGHHLAHRRRQLEAVPRHARGDEEARERRLVEDGHPVRSDVEGARPAARVARL